MVQSVRGRFVMPLVLIAVAVTCVAGPLPPLTVEEYLGRDTVGDVRLSHDGSRCLFTIGEKESWASKRQRHVWIVAADGGLPVQLTNGPGSDWDPAWSPDDRRVAFLSDRAGAPQVFVIEMSGGEARQITHVDEGVGTYAWAGGGRLAVVAPEPRDPAVVATEEAGGGGWVAGTTARTSALWLWDLSGDAEPIRVTDGRAHILELSASADGSRFALVTAPNSDPYGFLEHGRVMVVDHDGRELATFDKVRMPSRPRLSPDGRSVSIVSSTVGLSAADGLLVVDLATGMVRNLTASFEPTILDVAWLGPRALSFLSLRGTACGIYRVGLDGRGPEPLLEPSFVTFAYSVHPASRRLAFFGGRGYEPPSLRLHDFGAQPASARVLFTPNPWLGERDLARTEVIRYPSFDGQPIEAVLTLPPRAVAPQGPSPMVVMPHGGPDGMSLNDFGILGQLFAQAGLAVFEPNFRGGLGYGNAFYAANRGRIGDVDFRDIMAGVDHMVGRGVADPQRLLVGGWSFGGTMTLWTIGHEARFRAAVVVAGVSDYVSRYATSDLNRGLAADWEFMHRPVEDLDFFVRWSPLTHLRHAVTPTLVLHGEEDRRVPVGQAWESYRMLQEAGVESRMVLYPGAGHGISDPKQFADVTRRWLAWYLDHLDRSAPLAPRAAESQPSSLQRSIRRAR